MHMETSLCALMVLTSCVGESALRIKELLIPWLVKRGTSFVCVFIHLQISKSFIFRINFFICKNMHQCIILNKTRNVEKAHINNTKKVNLSLAISCTLFLCVFCAFFYLFIFCVCNNLCICNFLFKSRDTRAIPKQVHSTWRYRAILHPQHTFQPPRSKSCIN